MYAELRFMCKKPAKFLNTLPNMPQPHTVYETPAKLHRTSNSTAPFKDEL